MWSFVQDGLHDSVGSNRFWLMPLYKTPFANAEPAANGAAPRLRIALATGARTSSCVSGPTFVLSSGRFMPAAKAPFRTDEGSTTPKGFWGSDTPTANSDAFDTKSSCTTLALVAAAFRTRRTFPPAGGQVRLVLPAAATSVSVVQLDLISNASL